MNINKYLWMAAAVLVFATSCRQEAGDPEATGEEALTARAGIHQQDLQKRGAYLVRIIGCGDCHTPMTMTPQGPGPDPDRFLAGHPAEVTLPPVDLTQTQGYVLFNMTNTAVIGPWGTSFSANLTPDETGIGSWTEAQFKRALREGKAKGLENGRPLLPPMPWQNYTELKDEDISAIFAFLQSIKPVRNVVPAPVPPTMAAAQ